MHNFEYFNPVKILFGKDQVHNLSKLLEDHQKILLTYGGGSIMNNGIYEQIQKELTQKEVFEFGGISPNPQYEDLLDAINLAKEKDVDFILAVGGGSVIDASKFIAAAIHHKSDPWNMLEKSEPIEKVTPFGCVLTLPATGSEMNCFAVISKGKDKLGFGGDPRLYPTFSILDPSYTFTLSERQIGNGVVDAYVHVLEQYLTTKINTPIQDRFAEGILKTLIEEGPKVIEVKDDYHSRANLMLSATMALNGLIGSGVDHDWATHMIGHELTALYGLDHARSLAVILPSLLRCQKEEKKHKLLQYAQRVWSIEAPTVEESIELAINKTEDFFNTMGLPTKLKVYKINEDQIKELSSVIEERFSGKLGQNKNINQDKLYQILTMAL